MDFCLFDDIWPVRGGPLRDLFSPTCRQDMDTMIANNDLADFLSQGAVLLSSCSTLRLR
jgi:hypothetical protein